MAHVVVLGAGLGGTIMAYEVREELAKEHKVSVVTNGSSYSFVPSNPWVAVGWRDKEAIEVDLTSAVSTVARDTVRAILGVSLADTLFQQGKIEVDVDVSRQSVFHGLGI